MLLKSHLSLLLMSCVLLLLFAAPQQFSSASLLAPRRALLIDKEGRGSAATAPLATATPALHLGAVPPALHAACGLPPAPPLPPVPVRRIAIVGERHSGTNMMLQLLNGTVFVPDGVRAGVNMHKHWMQVDPGDPAALRGSATLLVLVVRNPLDWAERSWKLCYHCPGMQARPWLDFVRGPYESDQPDDTHLEEGRRPFASLLEMRRAKHCQWLAFAQRNQLWVEVVRHEDVTAPSQQMEFVRRLREAYDLPAARPEVAAGAFIGKDMKGGGRLDFSRGEDEADSVYLRPDTASAELRERAAALLPLLDPVLEKALGYSLPRPGAAAGELALMPLHPRRAGGAFEAAQARR